MKLFELHDEHGGVVAEGVEFTCGIVALKDHGNDHAVEYPNIAAVEMLYSSYTSIVPLRPEREGQHRQPETSMPSLPEPGVVAARDAHGKEYVRSMTNSDEWIDAELRVYTTRQLIDGIGANGGLRWIRGVPR